MLLVGALGGAGCRSCDDPAAQARASDLSPAVAKVVVSGRVLDGDEQPVSGARVVARAASGEKALAISDGEGRFAVRVPAGQVELLIESTLALPERFTVTAPAGGLEDLEVSLRRRIALAGRITLGGKHVAEAEVTLMAGERFSVRTTSNPEGRFAFGELGEARYALRVVGKLGQAYVPEVRPEAEVVVALQPSRSLMVKLLDDTGKPVAGELRVSEAEGPAGARRFAVPASGSTVLELLPGAYRLEVRAAGYLPQQRALTVGTTASESIALVRPARLVVVATDERGQPVGRANVSLGQELGMGGAGNGSLEDPRLLQLGELGVLRGPIPFPPPTPQASLAPATGAARMTAASGEVELVDLQPGKLAVSVSHPDFLPTVCTTDLTPGASARLPCVLRRGELVTGRVLDEGGRAIVGAPVTTKSAEPGATVVTDGSGRFSLRVPALPATLVAQSPGFAPASATVESHEVTLVLSQARDRLAGVVEDERGRVIAGAEVKVGERRTTSDGRGQFVLEGVGRPPQSVEIRHKDFAPLQHTTSPSDGTEVQRFVLPFGGGLDGRIVMAGPERLPSKLSLEVRVGRFVEMVKVLDDGTFRRTGLPSGRATVRVLAEGFVAEPRTLELLPGDTFGEVTVRDLELSLEAALRVRGTVRTVDGTPVEGARVTVGAESTTSSASGEFVLPAVAPGRVVVRAQQGGRIGEVSVEGRPAETVTVELELQ